MTFIQLKMANLWNNVCVTGCTSQRDLLFLLDASGSVEYNFDLEQQLTKQIIWGLNFAGSRFRVGLITWQAQERVMCHP